MKRVRRGISPIMSELMLLALVASIGTVVFILASQSIGTFGVGFNTLIFQRGSAVAQQPVVEFVRFHGSTPVARDLVTVFVRNVGVQAFIIERVVIQNATNTPSNNPFFRTEVNPSPNLACQPDTGCKVEPGLFLIITLKLAPNAWEPGVTYRIVLTTEQVVKVVEHAKP